MKPLVLIVAALTMASPAYAEKLIWKREPFPSTCTEIKLPDADTVDAVLYRCPTKLGPPMWQIFQDSARQSIGFGTTMNIPYLGAELTRGDWPLEWGGVMQGNKFVPRVAIARFRFSTGETHITGLAAYRILPTGTSCHLGSDLSGKDENAKTRQLAEDASTPCAEDDNIVKQ